MQNISDITEYFYMCFKVYIFALYNAWVGGGSVTGQTGGVGPVTTFENKKDKIIQKYLDIQKYLW